MATHQIPILGNAVPDNTGRCWVEAYDVSAANDVWKHLVFRFLNPASGNWHGIYGTFNVPNNYVGGAAIIPKWSSTATSGNCRWRFTYRAVGGDDAESMDQAGSQEAVSNTDPAGSAANERMTPTISLTAGNFAAGDTVEFLFERLDDSGTDTLAADVVLHDLIFQYADA